MQDLDYMKICLKLACKCQKYDDVPVGAIIVKNGVIVAKAYNQKEKRNSTISHAEILAIEKANKVLGANLSGCTLFTTKEPSCEGSPYTFFSIRSVLFDDLCYYSGSYCSSAFSDCESQSFFDCYRCDQVDFHCDVISRHAHLCSFR